MKVKIDFLPEFMRLVKPLWKKYASFEQDYMRLLDELRSNPFVGTSLGEGVRKVSTYANILKREGEKWWSSRSDL